MINGLAYLRDQGKIAKGDKIGYTARSRRAHPTC